LEFKKHNILFKKLRQNNNKRTSTDYVLSTDTTVKDSMTAIKQPAKPGSSFLHL